MLSLFSCQNVSKTEKQYGVSKIVICGICLHSGRMDNIKRFYFPRKHPSKIYFEKGTKLAHY